VELGDGPTVSRGASNHPNVVRAVLDAGEAADVDVQVETDGIRTGTDADAFFTARGGIPTLTLGIPNRYMHTPAEVVDTDDMGARPTCSRRSRTARPPETPSPWSSE